jgi:flavin reductase (DIM6/NTAB) family NADH-FMN oxidoreductase RutF
MISETGEFVINLVTKELAYAADWCGVKSGRDLDKFQEMKLTAAPGEKLKYAPIIAESPVNMECQVKEIVKLGSHHMFIAEVADVMVSEKYMNESGKFELNKTGLITYSHGEYFTLGEKIGKFGYSVKK